MATASVVAQTLFFLQSSRMKYLMSWITYAWPTNWLNNEVSLFPQILIYLLTHFLFSLFPVFSMGKCQTYRIMADPILPSSKDISSLNWKTAEQTLHNFNCSLLHCNPQKWLKTRLWVLHSQVRWHISFVHSRDVYLCQFSSIWTSVKSHPLTFNSRHIFCAVIG